MRHEASGGVVGGVRHRNLEPVAQLTYRGDSIDLEGTVREPGDERRCGLAFFPDLSDDLL